MALVLLMAALAAVLLLIAQIGDLALLGLAGGAAPGRRFDGKRLAEFDGVRRPGELYVSILGEVFDVSSKPQFYGPPPPKGGGGGEETRQEEEGGEGAAANANANANAAAAAAANEGEGEEEADLGYHVFVGRDGTRAFSTGEFTLRGATDRVVVGDDDDDDDDDAGVGSEGGGQRGDESLATPGDSPTPPPPPPPRPLDPEQLLELVEWLDFYRRTYPRKGVLAGGAFYDAAGRPKRALARVREGAARGLEARAERSERLRAAAAARPACESSWSAEDGGEVWCPGEQPARYPRRVRQVEEEEAEGGEGAGGGGNDGAGGSSSSPGAALKRRAERRRRERAGWRCVCFEEVGWSDLRQVYAGCSPEASRCKIGGV